MSSEHLERLADDAYLDRRIGGRIYCGNCGYNLHTLPYIYQCPECGQEYNARPLAMKGVYLPFQATAPVGDALAVIFAGFGCFVLLRSALPSRDGWITAMGAGAGMLALVYLCRVWRRTRLWLKAMGIERRIRLEEGEW